MALLITTDNRPIFVDAKTAIALWLIKTGERKGTAALKAKVAKIAKWHLNRETAPDSYLVQNPVIDEHKSKGVSVGQARLPYKD